MNFSVPSPLLSGIEHAPSPQVTTPMERSLKADLHISPSTGVSVPRENKTSYTMQVKIQKK